MILHLNRIVLLVAGLSLVLAPTFANAQNGPSDGKSTLGIAAIKPTPATAASVEKAGKLNQMARVIESLDSQLIASINATRKFEIVSRSDLKEILKEQGLVDSGNLDANDKSAAKSFKIAGVKYLLVTTLDDFQDVKETATFEAIGKTGSKRLVRASAVAKIYNSTTGKLLESANFQCSNKSAGVSAYQGTSDGDTSDQQLLAIARELADKVANRVADVIFPAKVLAKRDKQITVNRGDGTGIAVGQMWNVYAVGEELIDPDTKESLGREEVLVGKAKVVSVQPKTTTAELIEDTGVDKGAVLRLPPPPTQP